MTAADLSIVMVTYNSRDWVERCLSSFPTGLAGRSAELVVVDNASRDDSAAEVRRLRPDAVVLENRRNVGFAAAVNQAVLSSTAPWILLVNPDTEARMPAFANLLDFAETRPGHGIYGGRTTREDGSLEPSSCWALPSAWSCFCFATGLVNAFPHSPVFDPESMGRWARDTVREVGMVTGCLMLVARSTWEQLSGFDERYFVYGEDCDLAARARGLGYRPIITPAATVVHAIGASSGDDGAKAVLLLAGKVTYLRTHLPGIRSTAAVVFLRAGVALRALGARLLGRGGRWRRAWSRRDEWWNGFA